MVMVIQCSCGTNVDKTAVLVQVWPSLNVVIHSLYSSHVKCMCIGSVNSISVMEQLFRIYTI